MPEQPKTPLAGNYGVTLAVVLLALCPFILVTTSYTYFTGHLQADLGAGPTALEVANGLSNAGYAFGAIVGGFLTLRYPQRWLYLGSEAAFVAGSVLAAVAPSYLPFASGRILEGLATGLLLVIAIPPLTTRFPAGRLPASAAAINIGFFGAVTVGPLLGGATALGHDWRWFFAGLAALGAIGFVLGWSSLPLQDPPQPGRKAHPLVFVLAALGTGAPFFAVSQLQGKPFSRPIFWGPLAVGLGCLAFLIYHQYQREEPLVPVKKLTSSVPLAGTLTAMVGGAAFVTFLELAELHQRRVAGQGPLATGLTFWPQVAGLVVAAYLFYRLFTTRWVPHFVAAGLVVLAAGGGVLLAFGPGTDPLLVRCAAAALGFGAGATVSPGLWLAGLSVQPMLIGRVFALVELVRSEADFLVAPVLLHVAGQQGQRLHFALWVTLAVTIAGTLAVFGVWFAGRTPAVAPDLEAYLSEGEPAIPTRSPRELARSLRS